MRNPGQFEEQLRRANIPYKVFGGLSFIREKRLKILWLLPETGHESKDEEAPKRIVNYPRRGIGEKHHSESK